MRPSRQQFVAVVLAWLVVFSMVSAHVSLGGSVSPVETASADSTVRFTTLNVTITEYAGGSENVKNVTIDYAVDGNPSEIVFEAIDGSNVDDDTTKTATSGTVVLSNVKSEDHDLVINVTAKNGGTNVCTADGFDNASEGKTYTLSNFTCTHPANPTEEITTSSGTSDFTEGGGPVVVDDSLNVSGEDLYSSATVSIGDGFDAEADVLAADASSVSNISVVGYNSTTGVLTLDGNATTSEYETVLRTVTYNNTEQPPSTADRNITFTLTSANDSVNSRDGVYYSNTTGNYYEYVADSGITWTDAKSTAANRSYGNASGYLVTVTSSSENEFLVDRFGAGGWLGASDEAAEGQWRWVTGPEGDEAGGDGRLFFNQTAAHVAYTDPYADPPAGVPGGGSAVNGEYANWDPRHEPDNKFPFFGGQDYAYLCASGGSCPTGMWKDADAGSPPFTAAGYFVEYNGSAVDNGSGSTSVTNFSTSKTVTVSAASDNGKQPTAAISVTSPVAPGEQVDLDASSSSDAERYEWDVNGNGRTDLTGKTNTTSFQDAGNYTVTLTVTDEAGNTDTATATVEVTDNTPPTTVISLNQSTSVNRSEEIEFTASNSTDDTAIESFEWDFGDGSDNATGVSPTHGYTETGTYTVTLTVTDTAGNSNATTRDITVESSNQPVIHSFNATNPDARDLQVSLTVNTSLDTVTVEVYNTSGLSPRENDSDALVATVETADFSESSSGGNYTYTNTTTGLDPGNYTARLVTAEDANGDSGSGQERTATVGTDGFVYVNSSGWLKSVSQDGTVVDYGTSDVEVIGPRADIDNDGKREVPFINSSGVLKITDDDGETQQLGDLGSISPVTSKSKLAIGDWDEDGNYDVFFGGTDNKSVYRVDWDERNDQPEELNLFNTGDVPKFFLASTDITGDGLREVVFVTSSSSLYYINASGSTELTSSTKWGANNNIGLGEPEDFNDSSANTPEPADYSYPRIDGSNNVGELANDPTLTKTEYTSTSSLKSPLTGADWTGDGVPDFIYIAKANCNDNACEVKYLQHPDIGNESGFVTDADGNRVVAQGPVGLASRVSSFESRESLTSSGANAGDTTAPADPTAVDASTIAGDNETSYDVTVDLVDNHESGTVTVQLTGPSGTTVTGTASVNNESDADSNAHSVTVSGIDASSLDNGSVDVAAKMTDGAGNENPSGYTATTTVTKDADAPAYATGYPTTDNANGSGFDISVQADEDGTAYYVVVADGSSAPSVSQVRSGLNASGGSAQASGQGSLTADTELTLTADGLDTGTSYDIYVVVNDSLDNANLSSRVDVSTATAIQPAFSDAEVTNATDNELRVTFDANVSATNASGFSVSGPTDLKVDSGGSVENNDTVVLTLNRSVTSNESVSVSYDSANGTVTSSADGSDATGFTGKSVTNNVEPVTPAFGSAEVADGAANELRVTFDANVTAGTANGFTLTSPADLAVESLAGVENGDTVVLKLNRSTASNESLSFSYDNATGDVTSAVDNSSVANVTSESVTNNVAATNPTYSAGKITNASADQLRITFDGNVTASDADGFSVSGPTDLAVESLSGVENDDTVVLNLNRSVTSNESVSVSYDNATGNVTSTLDGSDAANFTGKSVTNDVAAVTPTYSSSTITDATDDELRVTFDANVSATGTSGFSVSGPSDLAVNSLDKVENGDTVVLTLNRSVTSNESVSVSYDNATGTVTSTVDNSSVANFTGQSVTNDVSLVRPAYSGSTISNTTDDQLRITFDANVSATDATGFSVSGPSDLAVDSLAGVENGDTVVLNLSRSVTSNESVSVSYDNATGTVESAVDASSVQNISVKSVTNDVDTVAPEFSSAEVTNATADELRVTFDGNVTASTPSGFTFTAPTDLAVDSLVGVENGNTVVLSLNRSVTSNESVSVSYDNATGDVTSTVDASDAANFTGETVTNNVAAVTPAYSSSKITNASADELRVTFDGNVTASNADGFSVGGPTDLAVKSLSGVENNDTVVLNLNRSVTSNESVSVSYDNATGDVTSTVDNSTVANFTGESVTNNVAAVTPAYSSSKITDAADDQLRITFDGNVSATNANGFSVSGPTDLAVDSLASVENGDTVVLNLSRSVTSNESVSVSYDSTSGTVESTVDASAVQNISGKAVTNDVAETAPAFDSAQVTNATDDELRVTFDANVSMTNANGFSVSGPTDLEIESLDRVENGDTVVLSLNRSVTSNESVSVSYDNATGDVTSTVDASDAANFTGKSVTNNVDAVSPAYTASKITNASADELRITFDGNVTASNDDGFSVSGPTDLQVSSLDRVENGNTVVLNLSRSVTSNESVSVSYDNTTGTVESAVDSSTVQNISGKAVTNDIAEVTPAFSSAEVTNDTADELRVAFDANVSATNANGFSVSGPTDLQIESLDRVENGDTVVLELNRSVTSNESVAVSYDNATGDVTSTVDGSDANSFTSKSVSNDVDSVVPAFDSAEVTNATADELRVSFDENVSATNANGFSVGGPTDLKVDSLDRVENGDTVVLELNRSVTSNESVSVSYDNATGDVTSTVDNSTVANFTGESVTNNVTAVTPTYSSSKITDASPDEIRITFDGNVTASNASGFSVSGPTDLAVDSLTGVENGDTVVLNLSRSVTSNESVSVSYDNTTGTVESTVDGSAVQNISGKSVTNDVAEVTPTFGSAAVPSGNDSRLRVTFDGNVTASNASGFSVDSPADLTVDSLVGVQNGDTVVLALNRSITSNESVSVSYDNATGTVESTVDGSGAANFTGESATNNVPDIAPAYDTAAVDTPRDEVRVTFDANVTVADANQAAADFTVERNGTELTVTDVAAGDNASTVVVTLGSNVSATDQVTLSYNASSATIASQADGSAAQNFSVNSSQDTSFDNAVPTLTVTSVTPQDDNVTEGDQLAVTVTIENTGGVEDTQTATLAVDSDQDGSFETDAATQSVTLAAGANTTITLNYTTQTGDAPSVDVRASTADDNATDTASVAAALQSVNATLNDATVSNGTETGVVVNATYTNGTTVTVTQDATLTSNDTSVATVAADGTVTAESRGTASIDASYGGKTDTATLSVTGADVVADGLTVTLGEATTPNGTETTVTVEAEYTNGTNQTVTDAATLKSNDTDVAEVFDNGTVTTDGTGTAEINATFGNQSDTATLGVTTADVVGDGLTVTVADAEVPNGTETNVTVTAEYTNGTNRTVTDTASLKSNDTAVARVFDNGTVTTAGTGTVEVNATFANQSETATLTVSAAEVVDNGITLTVSDAAVPNGTETAVTVEAEYTNGTNRTVTDAATLVSNNTAVAEMFDNGTVTTGETGTVELNATFANQSDTAVLTVSQAEVVDGGLNLTVSDAEVPNGTTTTVMVEAEYTNGSILNVTEAATLSVNDSTVATVYDNGTVTADAEDTAELNATYQAESDTATLSVTEAEVVDGGLTATLGETDIPNGTGTQVTVEAKYTNGTTQNVTDAASLTSNDTTVAEVFDNGTVKTGETGTVELNASYSGENATRTLTVTTAEVVDDGLTVTLGDATTPNGTETTVTVTAEYTNGTTQNVTDAATLTSNDAAVAQVFDNGTVTTAGTGTVEVNGTFENQSETAALTVSTAEIVDGGLTLTVSDTEVPNGTETTVTVDAEYTNGTVLNVTESATISVNDTAVATAYDNGTVVADSEGIVELNATYQGENATASLTVTEAEVVNNGLTVTLGDATTPNGTETTVTVTAEYTNGTNRTVTDAATLTSNDTAVAEVFDNGTVTSGETGTVELNASYSGKNAAATLTVTTAEVVDDGLTATLAETDIPNGTATQITVEAEYTNGTVRNVTEAATLSVTDTTIATVDSNGVVTSQGVGTVAVNASYSGENATATLTVSQAEVVDNGLTATLGETDIPNGTETNVTVTAEYTNGTNQTVTDAATLTSNDTAVAQVFDNGTVTTDETGTVELNATFVNQSEAAVLTVSTAEVVGNGVTVAVADAELPNGTETSVTVEAEYTNGTVRNVTDAATLDVNDTAVATVADDGTVTTRSEGIAAVAATFAGENTTATLTVTQAEIVEDGLTLAVADTELPNGTSTTVTVEAEYTNGTVLNVTEAATLSVNDSAVASLTAGGALTAERRGTVTVQAAFANETASTAVTVARAELVDGGLNASVAERDLPVGTETVATVTATFTNGTTRTVTASAALTSNDSTVATAFDNGTVTADGEGTAELNASYSGNNATATVTVTPAEIVDDGLNVTVADAEVANGTETTVTVRAEYTNGTVLNVTDVASLDVNDTAVAATADDGTVTTSSQGTVAVQAALANQTASTTLTVAQAEVVADGLTATLADSGVPNGTETVLTVKAEYTNGTVRNVSEAATITANDTAVVAVGADGTVSATGEGVARINATFAGEHDTATLTVTSAEVVDDGVNVTVADAAVPAGTRTAVTVTATYTNETTQVVTASTNLSVNDTAAATVFDNGTVTTEQQGPVAIQAAFANQTVTATLTVTQAEVVEDGLTLVVADTELPNGTATTATVRAEYTNGTVRNVTEAAAITTNDTAVVTALDNDTITADAEGVARVNATFAGEDDTATVTVTPAEVVEGGLDVSLADPEIPNGTTTTATVRAEYTNGTVRNVTEAATITANDTAVATVGPTGAVTAGDEGTADIQATFANRTATTTLTVSEAVVVADGLTATVNQSAVPNGTVTTVTVRAEYTNGTVRNVTDDAALASNDTAVATVAANGTVATHAVGAAAIDATFAGEVATATLTVTSAAVVDDGLTVTLANGSTPAGTATNVTVTATYTNGTTQTVTRPANLSLNDSAATTVFENGTITTTGPGTVTVAANYAGQRADADLVVTEAVVVEGGLTLTLAETEIPNGTATTAAVRAEYTNGTVRNATREATITANDTAVATVAQNGTVTATGTGHARLTTRLDGEQAAAVLNVTPVVTSVTADASANSYVVSLDTEVELRATDTTISGAPDEVTYVWRVDGRRIGTGPVLNTSFDTPGEKNVVVTVTADGATDTDNLTIQTEDTTAPVARLSVDETVPVGDPLALDASASTDNHAIANYIWRFGDGTNASGPSLESPTHTYDEPGRYTVSVTVTDPSGGSDTNVSVIVVKGPDGSRVPGNLTFENVSTGSVSTLEVTVTNDGTTPLAVDNVSVVGADAAAFTTSVENLTVRPGETRTVPVEFAPEGPGDASARLELASNDTDALGAVSLTGTGVEASLEPVNTSVVFGGVDVGTTRTATVAFRNTGNDSVTLDRANATGSGFTVTEESLPVTLAPGETETVTVAFAPNRSGTQNGTLTAAGGDQSASVSLGGVGLASEVHISPQTLSFPPVGVGDRAPAMVRISNYGNAPLSVENLSVVAPGSGQFVVGDAPATVPAGESAMVNLTFAPTAEGTHNTTFAVRSDDPTTPNATAPVDGRAVRAEVGIDRRTVDFGNVTVGETVVMNLTIRNKATSLTNLTVNETTLVGADPEAFDIRNGSTPFVLTPGENKTIQVAFTPVTDGVKEAQLQIISDAGNEPLINVWLANTRTYIVVQEVSNPKINVDGENLVEGQQKTVNTWTPTIDEQQAGIDRLDFTMNRSGGFEFNVDLSETPHDPVLNRTNRTTVQYAAIQHIEGQPNETFSNTSVGYRVRKDAIPGGAAPTNVTLHRWNESQKAWVEMPATLRNETDSHYIYETELPGFSQFAVSVPNASTADDTGDGDGGTTLSSWFDVSVTNVSDPVTPGERVEMTVRVENLGEKSATQSVLLTAPDGTVVANRSVSLYGLESTTVTFVWNTSGYDLGEYVPTVASDDDSETATVVVEAAETETPTPNGTETPPDGTEEPTENETTPTTDIPETEGGTDTPTAAPGDDDGEGGEPSIGVSSRVLRFDNVSEGEQATLTLVVVNRVEADSALRVDRMRLAGQNPEAFSVVGGGAPFTLAPGERREITVQFAPGSPGLLEAQLQIFSNDTATPQIDVWLTNGNGYIVVQQVDTGDSAGDTVNIDAVGLERERPIAVNVSQPGTRDNDAYVDTVNMRVVDHENFSLNITHAPEPQAPTYEADGRRAVQYVTLDYSVPADAFENTSFVFRVEKASVPVTDGPNSVAFHRYQNGSWTELDASLVEETDSHYVFSVDTPGFSHFAVSAPTAVSQAAASSVLWFLLLSLVSLLFLLLWRRRREDEGTAPPGGPASAESRGPDSRADGGDSGTRPED